jgi:hypothetical protein
MGMGARGRNCMEGGCCSVRGAVAAAVALLLSGCSVGVPDPTAVTGAPAAGSGKPAAPTVMPGHDAGAVAAHSMPFSAGNKLGPVSPAQLSNGLADAPGWRQTRADTGGAGEYRKSDGCQASGKVGINQWPIVGTGDRESTEKLFAYLDPTIQPEYLEPAALRWGGEQGKPGPTVEVLVLERAAVPEGNAAVMARVFGRTGSSIFVTVACPSAQSLGAARADVARWLTVVPPGE